MIKNDLSAFLGVKTCDKCNEPMKKGQKVIIVAEGIIAGEEDDLLTFEGSQIRFACHLDCWDGFADEDC